MTRLPCLRRCVVRGVLPLVGSLALAAVPVAAQDAASDDPAAVVRQLFDAMRARDTVAVRQAFHTDARLMSIGPDREGNPTVRTTPIDAFVQAIGRATAFLDERISGVEVRRDDGLATVWAHYAFFADSVFSHCGVDAFQLARTADGWKIIHVADTRQREGCDTPGTP
jgi:ketosteroid isomerase-like protein